MKPIEIEKDSMTFHLYPTLEIFEDACYASLLIPRGAAKGHLREIYNQFVRPAGGSGPGEAFSNPPTLRRIMNGRAWLLTQFSGLDI